MIKVIPGETLNIYVGGGGAPGSVGSPASGGYGFCGIGGKGGDFDPDEFPGGQGGLNKGGGEGAHPSYGPGLSSTSENGAGSSGGTATAGGIAGGSPGGGGSGGNGGCGIWGTESGMTFDGGVGSLSYYNCTRPGIQAEPGEAGYSGELSFGGAGGFVYILW